MQNRALLAAFVFGCLGCNGAVPGGRVGAAAAPSTVAAAPAPATSSAAPVTSLSAPPVVTPPPATPPLVTPGTTAAPPPTPSRFLYVANYYSNDITVCSIDPKTGLLTVTNPSVPAGPSQGWVVDMTVDPQGKYLFTAAASVNARELYEFAIDPASGALTFVARLTMPVTMPASIPAGPSPVGLAVAPSGKFLHVSQMATNDVWTYSLDPTTGALALVTTTPAGTSGNAAIDPLGRFIYVASSIFKLDGKTGALAPSTSIAYPPLASGFVAGQPNIAFTPDGKHAYIGEVAPTLQAYNVDSTTGGLVFNMAAPPSKPAPVPAALMLQTTSIPYNVVMHPTGKFVYTSNTNSNDVSSFLIDQTTGSISYLAPNLNTGGGPGGMAIDRSGSFLYVANRGTNDVYPYTINPTTGALTMHPLVNVGTSPVKLVTVP